MRTLTKCWIMFALLTIIMLLIFPSNSPIPVFPMFFTAIFFIVDMFVPKEYK